MIGKLFVVFLVAFITFESSSATTKNVVCYHGTWARYRTGNGAYGVSTIDTSQCTHLIYSFIGLNKDGTVYSLDEWLDVNLNNLNAFTSLKSTRSNLKVLVAIGGWTHSTNFPAVAASPQLRATFLQSALQFVQQHGFDGFDFDWEYPAQRGGTPQDVENFILLLKEFKATFEPLGLLLTAAVSASASSVAASYNVPMVSQYVDLINVMTYDLRGAWDGVTGHNAPLYASSIDKTAKDLQLNVDACISNWIAQGAAPEKIMLGIPFYGRSFTLASTADVSLGALSTDAGVAGPYTLESGYLGYNEIVEKRNAGGWTYVWDAEQQVPHMYNGDQWVGFDDERSVALKVQYAQSKGLGGVMIWAIETDDFRGLSGVRNPLLNAITNQLAAGSSNEITNPTTTTSAPTQTATSTTTTTTTPTTTASTTTGRSIIANDVVADVINSGTTITCTENGYIRDSQDCSKFYTCSKNADGSFLVNVHSCSPGLYFDQNAKVCNWKSAVTDCA